MGTQRKNDATYSHPWRDYFPIEGAIKQLSNYLKQEMFIFQTSTFDEMLLKLAWESNNFTGHIVWNRICFSLQKIYCFIYFIITRKIKLKQPHHCWCMDTTCPLARGIWSQAQQQQGPESECLNCWQEADSISGWRRLCDTQLGDSLGCQAHHYFLILTFLITVMTA